MNDVGKTSDITLISSKADDVAVAALLDSPYISVPAWSLYSQSQRWGYLVVLFLVSTSNYLDRNVISVLLEPIKLEFHVSDTMLGLLNGFCFTLFYVAAGVLVARWADHRGNRRTIITLALLVWSLAKMLCGLVQTFRQLALARVGVGAGESGAIPPAITFILTAPLFILAFAVGDIWAFTTLAFLGFALLNGGLPPVLTAVHAVCGGARRTTAISIVLFSASFIGGGIGPLGARALSANSGAEGLRYSLMIVTTVLFLSGALCYSFGRATPRDLEV